MIYPRSLIKHISSVFQLLGRSYFQTSFRNNCYFVKKKNSRADASSCRTILTSYRQGPIVIEGLYFLNVHLFLVLNTFISPASFSNPLSWATLGACIGRTLITQNKIHKPGCCSVQKLTFPRQTNQKTFLEHLQLEGVIEFSYTWDYKKNRITDYICVCLYIDQRWQPIYMREVSQKHKRMILRYTCQQR